VNGRAGRLPEWKARLIELVADEVITGMLDENFPLYVCRRARTRSRT
jgi:fumarate hydratase, class II